MKKKKILEKLATMLDEARRELILAKLAKADAVKNKNTERQFYFSGKERVLLNYSRTLEEIV